MYLPQANTARPGAPLIKKAPSGASGRREGKPCAIGARSGGFQGSALYNKSGYRDSNAGPLGPKPSALPTAPHPDSLKGESKGMAVNPNNQKNFGVFPKTIIFAVP